MDCNNKETSFYTGNQLLSILSQTKATPSDYLIKTYFKVYGIKSGELFEKFQRRFSNIQFNNFERISKVLATTVFLAKAQEIVRDELRNVSYVSCIYPYYVEKSPCPVIVQYFDPNKGIQHRILNFLPTFHGLSSLLSQEGILEKIVGYCGDFSYPDPATANRKSDNFSSLCILANRDDIKYLPYCDTFIDDLFEILVDYLPENVIVGLDTLGKTLVKMKDKTQFVQGMVEKYNDWRNSERGEGILDSNFAKCVADNFEAILNFFTPFQCLPRSIEALLCTVLKRYFLVLMLELYEKVKEIKLSDNCAVVYYFYLVQVQELFKSYKEDHFIPPKAYRFCSSEVARLVDKRVIDPKENKGDIDALYRDIFQNTDECYIRAIKYIDPLLQHFANFDTFSWLLLKKPYLNETQIHESYHLITGGDCQNCENLLIEVREINVLLSKLSLVEEESVVGKWLTLIRNKGPFPVMSKMLEYLLALPASYDIIPSQIKEVKGGDYGSVKKMIRFNWRRIEIVNDVEGFFGGLFETAAGLIKDNQMLPFED